MKKILIFAALILNISFASENPESLMTKANEFFIAGEYQKSIDVYQKLVSEGYKSPELLYNLANSYYRIGKIGYSILYYEKAKILAPSDEDINHNLNFVKLQTKDKIEKLPEFFLFEWWENILSLMTINQLTIFIYFLFLIALVGLLFYIISKNVKLRRVSFYASMIALGLLIFSSIILFININRQYNLKYGIILSESVIVKSSPDPISKEAFIIHEGLKVKIEDRVEEWCKIRLEDGKIGWISKDTFGII